MAYGSFSHRPQRVCDVAGKDTIAFLSRDDDHRKAVPSLLSDAPQITYDPLLRHRRLRNVERAIEEPLRLEHRHDTCHLATDLHEDCGIEGVEHPLEVIDAVVRGKD